MMADGGLVGAGFLTGGSLAIRGGFKAARNSAIGCAILLAVIEGVGIGIQRMMAENTRLDVRMLRLPFMFSTIFVLIPKKGTGTAASCESIASSSGLAESNDCVIRFAFFVRKILHSAIFGNLKDTWHQRGFMRHSTWVFMGLYYYTIDTARGWLKGAIGKCLQI